MIGEKVNNIIHIHKKLVYQQEFFDNTSIEFNIPPISNYTIYTNRRIIELCIKKEFLNDNTYKLFETSYHKNLLEPIKKSSEVDIKYIDDQLKINYGKDFVYFNPCPDHTMFIYVDNIKIESPEKYFK